uniref:Uncharacterized protein n=1 Tax=Eutreptiella gymnastica TaxID=73025 RepID=A0A7S4G2R0_9EUGL
MQDGQEGGLLGVLWSDPDGGQRYTSGPLCNWSTISVGAVASCMPCLILAMVFVLSASPLPFSPPLVIDTTVYGDRNRGACGIKGVHPT